MAELVIHRIIGGTPINADLGVYDVIVRAVDRDGLFDEQSFNLLQKREIYDGPNKLEITSFGFDEQRDENFVTITAFGDFADDSRFLLGWVNPEVGSFILGSHSLGGPEFSETFYFNKLLENSRCEVSRLDGQSLIIGDDIFVPEELEFPWNENDISRPTFNNFIFDVEYTSNGVTKVPSELNLYLNIEDDASGFIRQVYISRKRHTTLATGFMGMVGQVILIYIRMTAYIKGSILAKHLLLNTSICNLMKFQGLLVLL